MLIEGVPPAMIENAGKQAGMPVGPLSLNDEVGVDLGLKIMKATKAQLGERPRSCRHRSSCSTTLVEKRGPPRPQEPQGLLRLSGRRAEAPLAGPEGPAGHACSIPKCSTCRS